LATNSSPGAFGGWVTFPREQSALEIDSTTSQQRHRLRLGIEEDDALCSDGAHAGGGKHVGRNDGGSVRLGDVGDSRKECD
jgi:hypothetical protein